MKISINQFLTYRKVIVEFIKKYKDDKIPIKLSYAVNKNYKKFNEYAEAFDVEFKARSKPAPEISLKKYQEEVGVIQKEYMDKINGEKSEEIKDTLNEEFKTKLEEVGKKYPEIQAVDEENQTIAIEFGTEERDLDIYLVNESDFLNNDNFNIDCQSLENLSFMVVTSEGDK